MHTIILITIVCAICFGTTKAGPGAYTTDSLAVRAILDANGLDSVEVERYSVISGGRITQLVLMGKGLTIIPKEIGNLTALTFLGLHANMLESIPVEIGNLTNLEFLDLGLNGLTTLPSSIGNLNKLLTLHLQGNQIINIPNEIGGLSSLKKFWINGNKLTTIPTEIGNLVQLEELNLSRNLITILPPEIGKINILKSLYLNLNQLKELPPEIGMLTNLIILDLAYNQLESLPVEITNINPDFYGRIDSNNLCDVPDTIDRWAQAIHMAYFHDTLSWKTLQNCSQAGVERQVMPIKKPEIQIHPNPSYGSTHISFFRNSSAQGYISIYNAYGQRIINLMPTSRPSGKHTAIWDGRDERGVRQENGVYLVRLYLGNNVVSLQKLIFLN